jgi:N-methylhydantoinase B
MPVDSISLEVFKNLYIGVAEEMGVTLQRASFSPNIRERLDFSCAMFDNQGRMVAQAAHIPVHLGSMPASVSYALSNFEGLREGDVVVLNDPYRGGTHLPDITMVSPVYDGEGIAFYLASRAHHADVGGMSPGSLPLSTELYQEGLIIPPVLLRLSGWMNEGVFQLIIANSRNPQERVGDIEAQLSAHRIGEYRLRDIIAKHGHDSTQEHASALIDYSKRMTSAIIARIPDGEYRFSDHLEGDGQAEFDIPITANVLVAGDSLHVDFTGSASQVLGNVNAVTAIVQSAVGYCVRLLADDDIPMNDGCFSPISLTIPEGSVLNPYFPAAVSVGNTETAQRLVDVILGALAQALPDKIPAASLGTMNNVTVGGMVKGRAFVYYETIGGGHGASAQGDGLSARQAHMTNTQNTPIEALEMAYPIRIWRYEIRNNSGGKGAYRGGHGIIREMEFLTSATLTINSERHVHAPYGLQGGEVGAKGLNKIKQNAKERTLSGKASLRVESGDRLTIETPGGGGWGKTKSS